MIKKLLPDYTVKNVALLDESFYKAHGISAVIFDIDNTLVAHTEPTPPQNVLDYFELLEKWDIKYAIVSNNNHERVHSFCKELGVPYYGKALKPRKKYLKKTMQQLDAVAKETALVGDQLFTDMLGANRMGFLSVLVTAVGEDETSFVSFKRKFEKKILAKNAHKLTEYGTSVAK
ncbi:MAG: YqeG family HAD IIIA-type phosphatase [Ruminococcaceae bacterium]|nr:YqeG family HAD IIIA-type phosphatase [Oscillospiraceae bacterium]